MHAFPTGLIGTEAETDAAIPYQTAVIVRSLVAMMDGMCRARAVEWGPVPKVLEKSAGRGDASVIVGGGTSRMVMMVSREPLGGGVEKRRIVHLPMLSTKDGGRSRPKEKSCASKSPSSGGSVKGRLAAKAHYLAFGWVMRSQTRCRSPS